MECPAGTVGLASVRVLRGYWRASGNTSQVYKCAVDGGAPDANCLGGDAASFQCAPVLTNARFGLPGGLGSAGGGAANASAGMTGATAGVGTAVVRSVPGGGLTVANAGGSWLLGDTLLGNYSGVMCAVCPLGSGRDGDGRCAECPQQTQNNGLLTAYVVGLLVVIAVMLTNTIAASHAAAQRDASSSQGILNPSGAQGSSRARSATRAERVQSLAQLRREQRRHGSESGQAVDAKMVAIAVVKQIVTYCQVTSFMAELHIRWPPLVLSALDYLGRYSSPSLQLSSVDCAISASATALSPYFSRLLALAALPLLTVAGSGLFWLAAWWLWRQGWYNEARAALAHRYAAWRLERFHAKNLKRAERGQAQLPVSSLQLSRGMQALSAQELWSHVKTNFLVTSMVLLFLQHSSLAKVAFTFFSCRCVRALGKPGSHLTALVRAALFTRAHTSKTHYFSPFHPTPACPAFALNRAASLCSRTRPRPPASR